MQHDASVIRRKNKQQIGLGQQHEIEINAIFKCNQNNEQ